MKADVKEFLVLSTAITLLFQQGLPARRPCALKRRVAPPLLVA